MYCQKCGAKNVDDARFCNQCGAPIAMLGEAGGPLEDSQNMTKMEGLGRPSVKKKAAARNAKKKSTSAAEARSLAVVQEGSASADESMLNVWEDASYSEYDGLNVSTLSLSAMGVKSPSKAWGVILLTMTLLIGSGAAGMWFWMGAHSSNEALPENEDDSLGVLDDAIEMGDPEPQRLVEADLADAGVVDVVTGSPRVQTVRETRPQPRRRTRRRPTPTRDPEPSPAPTPPSEEPRVSGESSPEPSPPADTTASAPPTTTVVSGGGQTSPPAIETERVPVDEATDAPTEPEGSAVQPGGRPEPDWDSMAVPEERDFEMEAYSVRVRRHIRRYYASQAQRCFEHESRNDRSIRGSVIVAFMVQADGTVANARPIRNSTGIDALAACLATRVERWRLPRPPEAPLSMQMPFSR